MVLKKKIPVKATPKVPVATTPAPKPVVAPKAPVKRPAPKTLPKGAVKVEEKKEAPKQQAEPRKAGAVTEVTKPIVPAQQPAPESRPRETSKGTERLSVEAIRAMTLPERYRLFKKLNTNNEVFVPLRKELPKKMEMRKDEAVMRGIVEKTPPKERVKGTETLYCPYCVDWSVFYTHTWSGYDKCIGCSITSKDFYIQGDNNLWQKG